MSDRMLQAWIKMDCAARNRVGQAVRRFQKDESGAGIAEYAVVVGLAVLLSIGVLRAFWDEIGALFDRIIAVVGRIVEKE